MALIQITAVDGVYPSVSPRALPDKAATAANNLMSVTPEFRPAAGDTQVYTLPIANAKTIYRLDRTATGALNDVETTGWLYGTEELNIAKGAVQDTKGRIYFTDMSGTNYPAAVDATFNIGADTPHKLGVPAPAKPSVAVTVTNEYTVEEDTAARASIVNDVIAGIKSSFGGSAVVVGGAPSGAPTVSTPGWLVHGTSTSPALPTASLGDWAYLCPLTSNGSGGYKMVSSSNDVLLDPSLFGKQVSYGGNMYWAVPIAMQGQGYVVNTTTLSNAIQAIPNPDTGATPFVPASNANTFASWVADKYLSTQAPHASAVASLKSKQAALYIALGTLASTADAISASTVKAFYSLTAVTNEINSAVSNFAAYLTDKELALAHVRYPATDATTISAVNALITYDSAGRKTIDKQALSTLAEGYVSQAITNSALSSTDKDIARGQIGAAIAPLVDALYAVIDYTHWEKYADWPSASNSTSITGPAIADAIAGVQSAAKVITFGYDTLNDSMLAFIKNQLFDEHIGPYMPTPVARIISDRFYVATYVTNWGEESAPSAPTDLVEVDQNDIVTVTVPAPPVQSGLTVVGWRLYRTNSGSASTDFQLVADATAAGAILVNGGFDSFGIAYRSYADSLKSTELGEVCPTVTWAEPPTGDIAAAKYMRGLTSLPNGMLAGFVDNIVAFCEPYVPYAWPIAYQLTVASPVVCMASFGQVLVVATRESVDYMSGADSASVSHQSEVSVHTCVSSRSMVSVGDGVVYASADGLCLADSSGVKLITAAHFTREDWQALTPSTMVGAYHERAYYFYAAGNSTFYSLNLDTGKLTTVTATPQAFHTDHLTDRLYYAQGVAVDALFNDTGATRTATWKSKVFSLPGQSSFAWLKVVGGYTKMSGGVSAAAAINVRVFGDGKLIGPTGILYAPGDAGYTTVNTAVLTSVAPVRFPPGRFLEYQIEVVTASRWTSLMLASTTEELKSV